MTFMTNTTPNTLVLGGTGKTGNRVARALAEKGVGVRTAARSGADVHFDWNDASTYGPALEGVDRVYLVPPANDLDFAGTVGAFLDVASATGVRHVTYLSARGVEGAPPEVAMVAVEQDLAGRGEMTSTIVRPAWFMQNFSESFFLPTIVEDGVIPAPTGDGAEAFVSADDIAEVAATTLAQPGAHAGQTYTLTGPEPLTMAQAAQKIGSAAGREVTHVDLERQAWIDATVAAGVPADYAAMLGGLFDLIKSSAQATTTDDIRRVTGRPAQSFDHFITQSKAAWQKPVVPA